MGYKMLEKFTGFLCNFIGGFMLGDYIKNTSNIYILLCAIAFIAIGSFLIIDSGKERK